MFVLKDRYRMGNLSSMPIEYKEIFGLVEFKLE